MRKRRGISPSISPCQGPGAALVARAGDIARPLISGKRRRRPRENVQASAHFPRSGPNRSVCRLSPRWYRPTEEDPLRDMLVSLPPRPIRSSGRPLPSPPLRTSPLSEQRFRLSVHRRRRRQRRWPTNLTFVVCPDEMDRKTDGSILSHGRGRAASWKCSGTRCAPEWLLVPFSRFDTVNYSPASKLRSLSRRHASGLLDSFRKRHCAFHRFVVSRTDRKIVLFYGRTQLSEVLTWFLQGIGRSFHGNGLLTVIVSGDRKIDSMEFVISRDCWLNTTI